MELMESSGRSDGAALLEESCCPPKATEDIWFGCCFCTYATRDQHGIMSHLVTHGDEQFNCQHPLMSSGSRSKVHCNAQHTGDNPYKYKLCLQAFTQNCDPTSHNRKHTGEKPLKCKLCPQTFSYLSMLIAHNRTHTGERPFKCKLCPRAFFRSSSLKKHNRTHTREKLFSCKLCPQAFY
ncbi:hypothetical protein IscW_ISCW021450 [Ixodes scapularis]|uniref:C2H2-type domain-containing protein n=2 Tax=Ixodes scapularis TaxID=6945 RepID=B7Q5X5_IXOSC|nr:hypothetical protein IscW_ISCW021450 [Ixodes scapularis]|eukprot:XP_002411830.1 hypothetical protein IscW_ISCW021450 [Ixodes scapularis]